jgi:drug/metabolite transporter (DMT)-like permease
MLLVVAALALLPSVWRGLRAMPLRTTLAYSGIGALVALHWLTFYGAVKLANASVAATCIALAPAFHRRGRALAHPPAILHARTGLRPGGFAGRGAGGRRRAAWHAYRHRSGAVSALLVALFGSLNKRMVDGGDPLTVTGVELGAGTLLLTLLAPLMPMLFPAFAGDLLVIPSLSDGVLLLVLAIVCTLLPFALSLWPCATSAPTGCSW